MEAKRFMDIMGIMAVKRIIKVVLDSCNNVLQEISYYMHLIVILNVKFSGV